MEFFKFQQGQIGVENGPTSALALGHHDSLRRRSVQSATTDFGYHPYALFDSPVTHLWIVGHNGDSLSGFRRDGNGVGSYGPAQPGALSGVEHGFKPSLGHAERL